MPDAVACPTCGTWQPPSDRCTWCTVNMRTGSWVGSHRQFAARALKRLPPSKYEEPSGCGTAAGYVRHRYRHETPCEPCKEARRVYQRELRAARTEAKEAAA